jgi:putative phosphoribosyl transferase
MSVLTAPGEREVTIPAGPLTLPGTLAWPSQASGVVLFAHGSGSSRLSPRNRFVADRLRVAGLATLLFDLLTEREAADRAYVFDTGLLAERLMLATEWTGRQPELAGQAVGYFGASTGAAAALVAAAKAGDRIGAVVSRGGRPDLAGDFLPLVRAPTLLIVGSLDQVVLALNRAALRRLTCAKQLAIVPGATHLFEEPGTLEDVAERAARWFGHHLANPTRSARPSGQY